MEVLRRLRLLANEAHKRIDPGEEALRKIKHTDAVDLFIEKARELREKGDSSTIVSVEKDPSTSSAMVSLYWEMKKSPYSDRISWESKGVAVIATPSTDPTVIYTSGNYWVHLDDAFRSRPSALETLPLEQKIALAMKIAKLQEDFRYGKGQKNEKQILRNDSGFSKFSS